MTSDAKELRTKLFQYLDGVLERAEKKATNCHTVNGDKIKWERILIHAVSVYGKLLETEELEQRIEDLENKLKDGVLIPHEHKKN